MFELIIKQPGQREMRGKLASGAYVIGSADSCSIQLSSAGVSSRHAQLILRDNLMQIMDLGSSNGTMLDDMPLTPDELYEVAIGSSIKIGLAEIVPKGPDSQETNLNKIKEPPKVAPPVSPPSIVIDDKCASSGKDKIPVIIISGVPESVRPLVQEIKKRAHTELLKRLNLKKMALSGITEKELANKAKETIKEILCSLTIPLPQGANIETIELELVQEAIGLGPLEYLIARDDITEIMVNGPDNVYVECKGILYRTDTAFADSGQVQAAIERIVSPLGRRIDESSPMVDARLADGSRVNAIIPPLSLVGPSITIRKFSKKPFEIDDLIRFGAINKTMAQFLDVCVKVRKNIIISGGTGSGKTTLLNVLSSYLPNRERIVTIEDAAELQLHQEHIVRLESRPPNIEGKGAITIRDLVRNSLRMRPDRIVIGECRSGEALDMLQAMNTGHDGSLTTIHANTPRDALSRLETLVLMAGFDLPLRAIREQIASAISIIVQVTRERDGSRKVTNISEITKMEGEIITMQDIFIYKHEGWDADNRIIGRHIPTGNIPTFMEDIERAKLDLDISIFSQK